jgi:hypothetical protein
MSCGDDDYEPSAADMAEAQKKYDNEFGAAKKRPVLADLLERGVKLAIVVNDAASLSDEVKIQTVGK